MDIFGRYNLTISKSDNINTDYVANGSSKGEINMNNNKITNLATPTEDADSTTKLYVDQEVLIKSTQALRIANNLRSFRDGNLSMLGDLDMDNNKITNLAAPTEDNDSTNKKYTDDKINFEIAGESNILKGLINDRVLRVYDGKLKGNNSITLDPIDSKYKFFLIEYVLYDGFNSGLVPIRSGKSYMTGYLNGIMNSNLRMQIGILEINFNETTRELTPRIAYKHSEDWNAVNKRDNNDAYYISKIYLT